MGARISSSPLAIYCLVGSAVVSIAALSFFGGWIGLAQPNGDNVSAAGSLSPPEAISTVTGLPSEPKPTASAALTAIAKEPRREDIGRSFGEIADAFRDYGGGTFQFDALRRVIERDVRFTAGTIGQDLQVGTAKYGIAGLIITGRYGRPTKAWLRMGKVGPDEYDADGMRQMQELIVLRFCRTLFSDSENLNKRVNSLLARDGDFEERFELEGLRVAVRREPGGSYRHGQVEVSILEPARIE